MVALGFETSSIQLGPHFLSTIAVSHFNATVYCVSAMCQTQCEMLKYILCNPHAFSLIQHLK